MLGLWQWCCGGKMFGFRSSDVNMCTQKITFEMGLLYFFLNLVEGIRSPTFPFSGKMAFIIISSITQFLLSFRLFLCLLPCITRQGKNLKACLQSAMIAEFSRWQSEVSYCLQSLSKYKPRRWSSPIINNKAGTKG